jgi:hypothetical protein
VRVLLLGDISGTRDGQPWPPRGSEIDLPDDEAATLIRGNMARPAVNLEAGVERAVPPIEDVEQRVGAGPLTTQTGPARRRGRAGKDPADA